MDGESAVPGLIVHAHSGFFEVETDEGVVVAQLRGRLKQARQDTDIAAVGDRVRVRILEDGSGTIERVEPRERVVSRRAPGREAEQVLVANVDQAVLVFACAEPAPNLRLLDRMLVGAEREGIPSRVCANKIDLAGSEAARQIFDLYAGIGYPVHFTSARTGEGVEGLRRELAGRLSVFAGPSGAGKSSLLNAIQPGLGLRTGEISEATSKGTHTTVSPKLLRLQAGGYVADTPGVKAFALWDIEPEELDAYFIEMRDRVGDCAFSDCTHLHEPGCAVLKAVEQGQIDPRRYESYRRLRLGEPD